VAHQTSRRDRYSKFDALKSTFTNVYVKNLSEDIEDVEFQRMFSQYGKITSHVLVRDDQGKSRGFGFVNYELHDAASRAVMEMNGLEVSAHVRTFI
jgi:polyadenylate-binding protein